MASYELEAVLMLVGGGLGLCAARAPAGASCCGYPCRVPCRSYAGTAVLLMDSAPAGQSCRQRHQSPS
jgi:hypothetical protein